MARLASLREAVRDLVGDEDVVAWEGCTLRIPHAAGHELIRQRKGDLTLVRMTPDLVYDQLIGMGCARKLIFSWAGNPGVGSLHRFRDAVEHRWPGPLAIEEHSHAGMAVRYTPAAPGVAVGVLPGFGGGGLPKHTPPATPGRFPLPREQLTPRPAPAPVTPSPSGCGGTCSTPPTSPNI